MAQQTPDNFDKAKFEQRFRAADKDGDARLSREEAYAAFPRAAEYFMEIDANGDNYVTLGEIDQARGRRIEAVLNAAAIGPGARYFNPKYLKDGEPSTAGEAEAADLSSAIAQKRSIEFDEFLGDGQTKPGDSGGKPAPPSSSSNLLNKSFKPLSY